MIQSPVKITSLIILHAVGLAGMLGLFGWIGNGTLKPDLFSSLTPVHLLACATLVFPYGNYRKALIAFLIVFIIGFGIEVIGIKTGFPFGSYQYGNNLGSKLWGTPLLIGVNWWLLSLASISIARLISNKFWLKTLLAALLMLLLDFIIEPVAPKLDYWAFSSLEVPWNNYAAWFAIGAVVCGIQDKLFTEKKNTSAIALYFIQLAFFVGLLVRL